MENQHKRELLLPILFAFFIWLICIPLNAIPIYIKYSIDDTTTKSLLMYVLSDKDCIYIFIPICFVLLLEGGYYYNKGRQWLTLLSWIVFVSSAVLMILSLVWYIPISVSPIALKKESSNLIYANITMFSAVFTLGVFSHILLYKKKLLGEEQC